MHTYRILRPDDARELAMLHARAFDTPWSAAAIRSTLGTSGCFGLALMAPDLPDQIASFVLFQRALGEADMLTLATDPAHQRRGHAKALLAAAVSHLTERGVTRCLLEVAADNAPAIALYRGLGFAEDGRRKAYYARAGQKRVDAILMSSDLSGL